MATSKSKEPPRSQPLSNPFQAEDAIEKIKADKRMRTYLDDPKFRDQLDRIRKTENLGSITDPRLLACLGLLIGIEMDRMAIPDFSDEENDDSEPETQPTEPRPPSPPEQSQTKTSKQSKTIPSPEPSPKLAVAAKERGNAAYNAKNFEAALAAYEQAISLDPSNMTFINNKAAVFFEMHKYQQCIETCEKAVEVGRENQADVSLIAKALAREGKAYFKLGDEDAALKYLNKSLVEHRVADIIKLVEEVEKRLKEKKINNLSTENLK